MKLLLRAAMMVTAGDAGDDVQRGLQVLSLGFLWLRINGLISICFPIVNHLRQL
jgi:hypothetical protein